MTERPILFSGEMVRAILDGRKTQTRRLVNLSRAVGEPLAGPGEELDLWYPGARCHYGYRPDQKPAWQVQRLCSEACAPSPAGVYPPTGHVDWEGPVDGWPGPYDGRHPVSWGRLPFWPGLRLWVRETWSPVELKDGLDGVRFRADDTFRPIESSQSAADAWVVAANNDHSGRWRPAIYMPRWASRLTLEVTAVRPERLQGITEDDARAEGVDNGPGLGPHLYPSPRAARGPMGYRERFRQLWNEINGKRAPWNSNPWVWVVEFRVAEHGSPTVARPEVALSGGAA